MALALSGCESGEDRAERHFSNGVALIEQGEVTQGLLELRNAVRLLPEHVEARLAIARAENARGRSAAAFGEFMQVVERAPEQLEARVALARLALQEGEWAVAERHGRAAEELAPDTDEVRFVVAMLDYRDAMVAEDRAAADDAAGRINAMIDDFPRDGMAWRLVIDHALAQGTQMQAGLARLEEALVQRPDIREFHELRIRVLNELARPDALREALHDMYAQFPDDEDVLRGLVGYLMQRDEQPAAEELLRVRADLDGAPQEHVLQLLDFINTTLGSEAALAEVDARIAAAEDDALRLHAARAVLRLGTGDHDGAIAELETALAAAAPSDERNDVRAELARMALATGETDRARAMVAEILDEDSRHVEALKLHAAWLIDDERTTDAIAALRTAQGRAPRDTAVMLLLGRAHEREGDRGLAGERYAQAVELSGNAARESLNYAGFLLVDNRLDAAESVLTSALREAPANADLIAALGQVQVARGEWDRAQRSIWQLRALDTPAALRAADALEADSLMQQGRTQDTIAFLETLVADGSEESAALAALLQTQVRAGEIDGARALLEERLAERPDDPTLRFLGAGMMVLDGEIDAAEAVYRELLAEFPSAEAPLRVLHGLMIAQGRIDDAQALIDAVLAEVPEAVVPRMLRAARLEQEFDFEGAIAIYEELYASNRDNLVFANNLASLMATHRDDAESLERAFLIARRLSGTEVPAFRDTYGWIQYRRGNHADAVTYLEPAAAGLPNDPFVQYHLGMAYHAVGRTEEARVQLQRAIDLAGGAVLPQFDRAREILASLADAPADAPDAVPDLAPSEAAPLD
ncbi:tetratricopeptide repeat protein [Rhodobaculum claviforme]|nr:tetratricopeptide repeat protein [Rhodobaculum claviforme]